VVSVITDEDSSSVPGVVSVADGTNRNIISVHGGLYFNGAVAK
jgi:hypothetical protein